LTDPTPAVPPAVPCVKARRRQLGRLVEETPQPADPTAAARQLEQLAYDLGKLYLAGRDEVAGRPTDELSARLYQIGRFVRTLRPGG
jgi:hypothetical protein